MKELERRFSIPFEGGQLTCTLILQTESDDPRMQSIIDDLRTHAVDLMNGSVSRLMAGMAAKFGDDGDTDVTRVFSVDCGSSATLELLVSCQLDKQLDPEVVRTTIARCIAPHIYAAFVSYILGYECDDALANTDYSDRAVEMVVGRFAAAMGIEEPDFDFFRDSRHS